LDLPILEKVLAIPIQIYIFKQYCNTLAILKSVLAILSIAIQYCNINNRARVSTKQCYLGDSFLAFVVNIKQQAAGSNQQELYQELQLAFSK